MFLFVSAIKLNAFLVMKIIKFTIFNYKNTLFFQTHIFLFLKLIVKVLDFKTKTGLMFKIQNELQFAAIIKILSNRNSKTVGYKSFRQ